LAGFNFISNFERKFIALNLTYSPRFLKLAQNLICSNKLARILPLKRLDKAAKLSNLNNCYDIFTNIKDEKQQSYV
jgi:hypothetical protein